MLNEIHSHSPLFVIRREKTLKLTNTKRPSRKELSDFRNAMVLVSMRMRQTNFFGLKMVLSGITDFLLIIVQYVFFCYFIPLHNLQYCTVHL